MLANSNTGCCATTIEKSHSNLQLLIDQNFKVNGALTIPFATMVSDVWRPCYALNVN